MLKIYICEDIEVQRDRIQQVIENIVLMEDLDMELSCVSEDPHEILEKVKAVSYTHLTLPTICSV